MYNELDDKIAFKWYILPFLTIFMLGWVAGSIFSNYNYIGTEKPLSIGVLLGFSPELRSPSDHISESRIHVLDDKVVLDIKGAQWASFTDTNSMDPLIDKGANSIEIKPNGDDEINIGDIISFRTEFDDGIIIHRVVGIGEDAEGKYYLTKGDNNPTIDPGKVRFKDVNGLVVGVIY